MKKFNVIFDDIAEGRVRLFEKDTHVRDVHFDTYDQALHQIDELRDKGWNALNSNAEAIEALLRTAHLYHKKCIGGK